MVAPRTRNVAEVSSMKDWSRASPSSTTALAKGPCPRAVAQMAIAATSIVANAAPRTSKRSAAQIRTGASTAVVPFRATPKRK
jgi:hypothetical protein